MMTIFFKATIELYFQYFYSSNFPHWSFLHSYVRADLILTQEKGGKVHQIGCKHFWEILNRQKNSVLWKILYPSRFQTYIKESVSFSMREMFDLLFFFKSHSLLRLLHLIFTFCLKRIEGWLANFDGEADSVICSSKYFSCFFWVIWLIAVCEPSTLLAFVFYPQSFFTFVLFHHNLGQSLPS